MTPPELNQVIAAVATITRDENRVATIEAIAASVNSTAAEVEPLLRQARALGHLSAYKVKRKKWAFTVVSDG